MLLLRKGGADLRPLSETVVLQRPTILALPAEPVGRLAQRNSGCNGPIRNAARCIDHRIVGGHLKSPPSDPPAFTGSRSRWQSLGRLGNARSVMSDERRLDCRRAP